MEPDQKCLCFVRHVFGMMHFVYYYYDRIREGNVPAVVLSDDPFLPALFSQMGTQIIHKALEDLPLLELSSQYLLSSDREYRLQDAFWKSYTNDFSDSRVIEWATLLCTVSNTLHRKGFEAATTIAREIIIIKCFDHSRYEAFKCISAVKHGCCS